MMSLMRFISKPQCAFHSDYPSAFPTMRHYISLSPAWFMAYHSGLPSERINLSPFTKDFRGGGHSMSLLWICCLAPLEGLTKAKHTKKHGLSPHFPLPPFPTTVYSIYYYSQTFFEGKCKLCSKTFSWSITSGRKFSQPCSDPQKF